MKKDGLNIMRNIQIIEKLKAELICIIGDFYKLLTKGSNVAQEALLDCISGAVTILYILADRLGYSYTAVDENIKKNLKMGIIENDEVEVESKDLSRLYTHIKERQ